MCVGWEEPTRGSGEGEPVSEWVEAQGGLCWLGAAKLYPRSAATAPIIMASWHMVVMIVVIFSAALCGPHVPQARRTDSGCCLLSVFEPWGAPPRAQRPPTWPI